MNVAIVSGNLTKDVEIRNTDNTEKTVAMFTLAENTNPENPEFIPCKAFGAVAKACAKYLKKGNKALVRGYYHNYCYTNKNSEKVYGCEVIANNVEFLTPNTKKENEEEYSNRFN